MEKTLSYAHPLCIRSWGKCRPLGNKWQAMLALVVAWGAQSVAADTITVSAASSLTDAFKEIAKAYEAQNPGDKVNLNFAASGVLLQQIDKGAPVDVFASADEATMNKAQESGLVVAGTRQTFAKNALVLIQPLNASAGLDSLEALQSDAVQRFVVGNPESVPVGRYTKGALQAAGLWDAVLPKMIQAQNVRQALDYVARGEVDVGFVYASDAAQFRGKVTVSYHVPAQTPVTYPIAVIKNGGHADAARRFVALVTSLDGQAILVRFGFGAVMAGPQEPAR